MYNHCLGYQQKYDKQLLIRNIIRKIEILGYRELFPLKIIFIIPLRFAVKEIVNRKARTRRNTELANKSAARRLTMAELDDLMSQLEDLACVIKDANQLEVCLRASMYWFLCK